MCSTENTTAITIFNPTLQLEYPVRWSKLDVLNNPEEKSIQKYLNLMLQCGFDILFF